MITKDEAKQIKTILGAHYTGLVQKVLLEEGALNKNGKAHTANQIRVVLSGNSNNDTIEKAIFKAVEKKQLELEERKNILTKKTVALTTES